MKRKKNNLDKRHHIKMIRKQIKESDDRLFKYRIFKSAVNH